MEEQNEEAMGWRLRTSLKSESTDRRDIKERLFLVYGRIPKRVKTLFVTHSE
jgi:hypothetical protein